MNKIINIVTEHKSIAVKNYLYEAASCLRSIENNFKGQYLGEGEEQLEATEENFIKLLVYHINRNMDQKNKLFLIQILRDIKIKNLLDK